MICNLVTIIEALINTEPRKGPCQKGGEKERQCIRLVLHLDKAQGGLEA